MRTKKLAKSLIKELKKKDLKIKKLDKKNKDLNDEVELLSLLLDSEIEYTEYQREYIVELASSVDRELS